ncbi:MAG TPA: DUF4870 domain-containing protein [Ignavibacteria bacterium]|nr:DUF4870 domain-containing protein [Ignavibacteria bacterium]HQY52036.1 DUF4870 domain-containing protein [Ignavibacteria bacterium]HRA99556.1 DUF4870 domain-containing protein [Ignavibacteria bacterium]
MDNNITINDNMPSNEDRTMALLSHLSLILGGILLPLIIWATQKDKSKFVRFHSLQSIFFHLSIAAVIIFFVIFFAVIFFASGLGMSNLNSSGNSELPAFFIILIIAFYAFIILLVLGAIAYSIYLALKAYKGERIKVFFIGNIIYKKVYGQS